MEKLAFTEAHGFEILPETEDKTVIIRKAPKEFTLIKFGKNDYTIDGDEGSFDFDEADADDVINEFGRRGKDLLIDIEHASLIPGNPAPAYGWGKCLKKGKNGLVAEVDWTDEAKEMIEKGKYKYHSPVLYFAKKKTGKRPRAIHSVTMTNHPALHRYDPLVASDTSDTNLCTDSGMSCFQQRLISLKNDIDFNTGNTKARAESQFEEVLDAFSDYSANNHVYCETANMLFLSDISDEAKKIFKNMEGDDAIRELERLKQTDDITDAEAMYIEKLIEKVGEDSRESAFADSSVNTNKQRSMKMLTKKLKNLMSFADGDMTIDEMTQAELTPDGDLEGEQVMDVAVEDPNALLDQAKDLVRTSVEQINALAELLGISGEEDMAEMEGTEAFFDTVIKKISDQKVALDRIADAYGSERKDDPLSLADMVIVQSVATPPQEEVRKMTERLAMTDKKIQEEKAIMAVDKALQAGTVPESNREKALEFAKRDLQAFSDAFLSETSVKVVPIDNVSGTQTEKADKQSSAVLALSDRAKKMQKSFGLSDEEAVKLYGKA